MPGRTIWSFTGIRYECFEARLFTCQSASGALTSNEAWRGLRITRMRGMPDSEQNKLALTILLGFFIARLFFAVALGLGIDESYTIAISRHLCLSYFDHPPLHLWIAHFSSLVEGESAAARAPFVALFFATAWIYYRFRVRAVRSSIFANRAFRPKRYAFLFRISGGLDRTRWAVAFWVGGSRVGGEPPVLFEASRSGLGLAILDPYWRWPGFGRTGEVQRRATRGRTSGVRNALIQPAALAQTSSAVCLGDCGVCHDNAGHCVERAARVGVLRVSGCARRVRRRIAPGTASHNGRG